MDVPAFLRAARGIRKVSQRDLAELAGVPRSTIDRIEAGLTDPKISTVARLFQALGYELLVCSQFGRPLRLDAKRESLIDGCGRHLPPHWEYREVRWLDSYWAWWRKRNRGAIPTHTYWYRYPGFGVTPWEDAT